MLHKTRGIVFRFTKYGESSIIANIFTELFGLRSYIVNGVRSKSAHGKIALYQPLTLVDLVVYHRENANINRIKEIKCLHQYQTITTDIRKSAVGLFLNEVINKAIREESHASELCTFLVESFVVLDTMTRNVENFHLVFLLKLSRLLGFGANQASDVIGIRGTTDENETLINNLIRTNYTDTVRLTNVQRREILELILSFYDLHIGSLGEWKSITVLREVLG